MIFKNICCLVILYNPCLDTWDNIQSYSHAFAKLLIFDNSDSTDIQMLNKIKAENIENAVYLSLSGNMGISLVLNYTFNMAITEGFQHIITMDQDSSFSPSVLFEYHKAFLDFCSKKNAAVLGMGYNKEKCTPDFIENRKTDMVITSGSIFSLVKYIQIGGFDERFFIDWVDDEYCCHARLKGYEVFEATGVHLNHNIGQTVDKQHLLTRKKITRAVHSPLRFYYMLRNFFLIKKIYNKTLPAVFNAQYGFATVKNRFKNILLYGDGIVVFYYVCRAMVDYKKGRFGKFQK